MARRSTRGRPTLLVWVVAVAAMLGAALQAADALPGRRSDKILQWTTGAFIAFGLAVFAERYKLQRRR